MSRLVTSVLFAGFVLIGQLAVRLGLRRRPDGWRRTVAVGLRHEGSKFTLTAFGLKPPSDAVTELNAFLRREPSLRYRIEHRMWQTIRVPSPIVDVVVCEFSTSGELATFLVYLDPTQPCSLPSPAETDMELAILEAHAATLRLPEDVRPQRLARAVRKAVPAEHWPYAERILSAVCISFDHHADPTQRFRTPSFPQRRTLGGWLHVTLRAFTGESDVWLNVHHSAADGVAMQDLLAHLQACWPPVQPMQFPASSLDPQLAEPRRDSVDGEREAYEGLMFLDFSPLLELRRLWNADPAIAAAGGATVGAVLLWQLNQQPYFAGKKISTTADVAATAEYERDVDLVAIRAAEFADRPTYVKHFNELVAAGRERSSPTRQAMQLMSLVPAWLQWHMLRTHREEVRESFGSIGLSIVKEASVIVPPLSDVGYEDGFITIGNLSLLSVDGGRVGCVSAKGTAEQVREILPAIRAAVTGAR